MHLLGGKYFAVDTVLVDYAGEARLLTASCNVSYRHNGMKSLCAFCARPCSSRSINGGNESNKSGLFGWFV